MPEWPDPEMLAVYDPPRLPSQPSSTPVLNPADGRGPDSLGDEAFAELSELGIHISMASEQGVEYFAMCPERAKRELRRQLGPDVPIAYSGASRYGLRPHRFGSWLADGLALHLFYALPRNGEQAGGAVIVEREDCVLVSLLITDWLGAKTLVGGFTPSHETVTMTTELGQRAVIDCSANRARPHWRTAATTTLPRPQDL